MKSFYQVLQENGYSKEEANSICICIENELPIKDKKALKIHYYWVMEIIKEGGKNETINNQN